MKKKWYKSRTNWANFLVGVGTVALNTGLISVGVPPAQLNSIIAIGLPLVNMGLRAITKVGVKL